MPAEKISELVVNNQTFLMRRALQYAQKFGYTKYTSTLEEAWQASIQGLTHALVEGLRHSADVPEILVDTDFSGDPMTAFGVLEAKLHRNRGITLGQFLSLMKYYRQAYLDLVLESGLNPDDQYLFTLYILRFFDRVELAFTTEWASQTSGQLIDELQNVNRIMTNEKNKYLTIFESIPTPVILLDTNHYVDNMNHAACDFLRRAASSPGALYYGEQCERQLLGQTVPWLIQEFNDFIAAQKAEMSIDKDVQLEGHGRRNLAVKFHRMLDISEKYKGTVIIFSDLTDRKLYEERLYQLSFHDQLTGIYNRAYFEQEMSRMSGGRFDPVGIIVSDLDGLKQVNDCLGHQAGDILIQTAAGILRTCFRDSDIVARVGGDEFVVLLPNAADDSAAEARRRINSALADHNKSNPQLPILLSMGIAVGNAREIGISDLYKQADDAMYREKQQKKAAQPAG